MRVSLTSTPSDKPCSRCGANDAQTIVFGVIVDGHNGEAEPLCALCLSFDQTVSLPMENLAPGPAPRRKALKKAKKTSLRQELDIAEEFGGRTQPGSGNQAGAKGDVRKKGDLRIEAKYTQAESYSLKLDELYKIAGEAAHGELPVFVIDFLAPGTRKLRDRFAVIHADHFQELHGASKNRGPKRPA